MLYKSIFIITTVLCVQASAMRPEGEGSGDEKRAQIIPGSSSTKIKSSGNNISITTEVKGPTIVARNAADALKMLTMLSLSDSTAVSTGDITATSTSGSAVVRNSVAGGNITASATSGGAAVVRNSVAGGNISATSSSGGAAVVRNVVTTGNLSASSGGSDNR